jgi:hypothetical protein
MVWAPSSTLLVAVVVVALVLWIISLLSPPLDGRAKQILQVIVAVILLFWIIAVFFGAVPVPIIR